MKLIVILFSLFFGILSIIMIYYRIMQYSIANLKNWFLILGVFFMVPVTLFMIPTHRIYFDSDGITVTWQIGFGKLILYRFHEFIPWKDVRAVTNILNVWLPFHLMWVNTIWIGSFMTHNKDALLYIADHVDEKVMDDEVKKLVRKYRQQREKKNKNRLKG